MELLKRPVAAGQAGAASALSPGEEGGRAALCHTQGLRLGCTVGLSAQGTAPPGGPPSLRPARQATPSPARAALRPLLFTGMRCKGVTWRRAAPPRVLAHVRPGGATSALCLLDMLRAMYEPHPRPKASPPPVRCLAAAAAVWWWVGGGGVGVGGGEVDGGRLWRGWLDV